jgi:hypothetical protein
MHTPLLSDNLLGIGVDWEIKVKWVAVVKPRTELMRFRTGSVIGRFANV